MRGSHPRRSEAHARLQGDMALVAVRHALADKRLRRRDAHRAQCTGLVRALQD